MCTTWFSACTPASVRPAQWVRSRSSPASAWWTTPTWRCGGRRSAAAIAAATALNLPFGTLYAFSVLLKPLEALLSIGRAETSVVFALATIFLDTKLCVVDPENSAFFPSYAEGSNDVVVEGSSRIEGIGRPRVEPSFLPDVVDRMDRVPDAASVAGAHHVSTPLDVARAADGNREQRHRP